MKIEERETEWLLQLRTVHPYVLHEKVDIRENDKNVKKFKSDGEGSYIVGIVRKIFPSFTKTISKESNI